MYHWCVAIDPVLNLIVIFLFSSEPGEGIKKGDQMSWWQHAALSKVALSIKIDREREGDISAGPLLSDILEKLSFLFCHHLFLSTKSIDALTVAILAMAFTPSRDHERVQMYRYKAGSLVHYIYQM